MSLLASFSEAERDELEHFAQRWLGRKFYLDPTTHAWLREERRRFLGRRQDEWRWWFDVPIDVTLDAFARHTVGPRELLDELAVFDAALLRQLRRDFTRRAAHLDGYRFIRADEIRLNKRLLRDFARLGYVDRERWAMVRRLVQEQEARTEAWRLESKRRAQLARQRKALREGHRTLTALRRLLRDRRSSLPLASQPARTSQTS